MRCIRAHIFSRASSLVNISQIFESRSLCIVILLVFSYSLPNSPESVGHECRCSEEVGGWAEVASRKVALVLDGAIAARGRHILRHLERVVGDINWFGEFVMRSREVGAQRWSVLSWLGMRLVSI